jgi:hypothetical protein
MMKQMIFALLAFLLVQTCLGAANHISKNVPKKICKKGAGWTVFSVKNNNFNPPSSNPKAQDLLLRQMKKVAPRMLKEAKSSKNATLLAQFGTEYSWVLDGCMKVSLISSLFPPLSLDIFIRSPYPTSAAYSLLCDFYPTFIHDTQ